MDTPDIKRINGYESEIADTSVILEKSSRYGEVVAWDSDYGRIALLSDIGPTRKANQDSFVFVPRRKSGPDSTSLELLFGVIDGMGGYFGGEEAAEAVAETIARSSGKSLTELICDADTAARAVAKRLNSHAGATGAFVSISQDELIPAIVGDGRAYVFDEKGNLRYISKDQSQVQELIDLGILDTDGAERNVVTNCFGVVEEKTDRPKFNPSISLLELTKKMKFTEKGRIINAKRLHPVYKVDLHPGHQVLVLTDGAHDAIPNREIMNLYASGEQNPQEVVRKIKELAYTHNSGDNATAVAYIHKPWVDRTPQKKEERMRRKMKETTTVNMPIIGLRGS